MIYAIIILFVLVVILFIKVSNRTTESDLLKVSRNMSGQINSATMNLDRAFAKKLNEALRHMHAHFSSVKKIARDAHNEGVDRDLELQKVLNEFLALHGYELVLEDQPVDMKPIIESFKGSLPDFMQKIMAMPSTVVQIDSGITEKVLVLKKKVVAKKPRRK